MSVEKVIKNLEPLLDAKNQSWAQAEKMLIGILGERSALAKQEQGEPERCHGCEACINTACGRDECPKGWPKASQPKQEQDDWGWGPHESHSQPKQEDYLSKAYRLANELRCHLAIAPAPQQRTWVGLTDEQRLKIAHRAANFDWVKEYLDAVEFVIDQTEAAHGITEENT